VISTTTFWKSTLSLDESNSPERPGQPESTTGVPEQTDAGFKPIEAADIDPEAVAKEDRARVHSSVRWRRWAGKTTLVILVFILSLCGSAVAVTLFGTQTFHWRAFDIEVGIQPSLIGETRLIFAPLGEVRAHTHEAPVAFKAGLKSISFDEMKKLVVSPPPRKELEIDFQRVARQSLQTLIYRQIALGACGALVVPLLFRFKRFRYWLACALLGAGFVAGVFYFSLNSFNPKAFESPSYTGSLREADWIIALVKDGFNKAEALSEKLRHVASNLNTLYSRINSLPGNAETADTIRILHISDIHNNPAAVDFVRQLADSVHVDAVIDTGDLTDFGSPIETSLSQGMGRLNNPYIFIAGNHDSQATVRAISANRNAVVLNGKPVNRAGLWILGSPDPSSAREANGSVDTPLPALQAASVELLRSLQSTPPSEAINLVCVHDPKQAEAVIGHVPLILCGHEHRAYIEVKNSTVICNAGTTGAAGARYFDKKQGVAVTAAILTFGKTPTPHLLYIDQVALDGTFTQYSITRRSFSTNLPKPSEVSPPLSAPSGSAVNPPAP
jgi:predicted MPP superfamily phosphohydrolase